MPCSWPVRPPLSLAFLLVFGACGDRLLGSGASEGEGEGTGEEGEDPEGHEPQSCGDGVVDPGEFCHRSSPDAGAGLDPCALAVADFDRDGRLDCAVPNSDFAHENQPVHVANVLLGHGDGTLGAAQPHAAGGPLPVGIAAGDFDADGLADLAVANWQSRVVNVLGGQGTGEFAPPVVLEVEDDAHSVAAGDLDRDGYDDLVVVAGTRSAVALLRSGPDGFFPVEWLDLPDLASRAIVVDVTGDGLPDVVASLWLRSEVAVVAQRGDGTFDPPRQHPTDYGPNWVFAADMDGGPVDLLTANMSGTVDILAGQGGGDFSRLVSVAVGWQPQSVTAGDFDMDGHLDFAVSDESRDEVIVVTRRAAAVYEERGVFAVGSRPVSIQAADFNGDGVLDLGVANQFSNSVSLIVSDP